MQERLEEVQEEIQDLTPTEQPAGEPTAEPDYRAKSEELEAQIVKLENDLRSREGQRRKESDRDAELSGLRDELGAVRRMFAELAAGMSSGNLEAVAAQTLQTNQELDRNQADRNWNIRYNGEQERLLATVCEDDKETLRISEADAQVIQDRWKRAWELAQQGNFDEVYQTHIEAHAMVLKEERRKSGEEKQRLRNEAKTAGKKALENAGIADLDTGAAIAGGNEPLSGAALIERGLRKQLNTRL